MSIPQASIVYCENRDIAPPVSKETDATRRSAGQPFGVMPYAVDPEAAERLWSLSERLVFEA